jgi:hypothetical protein
MKVPYAENWQKETDALRKGALGCGMGQELKWRTPWFTHQTDIVAIIIAIKEMCALSCFLGRLAQGPEAHSTEDRKGSDVPLDQVHLTRGALGTAAGPQARAHRCNPERASHRRQSTDLNSPPRPVMGVIAYFAPEL